uniref:Uncharacterized protein LOC104242871 n=1 Tax=Nicotiana sylvestris TaxID=4096 RepID=A0A1U7XW95_NICSY
MVVRLLCLQCGPHNIYCGCTVLMPSNSVVLSLVLVQVSLLFSRSL